MPGEVARRRSSRPNGFTLIELLVALTIVALLLSIVSPRYFSSVSRAEEAVLRENLTVMRDAIDKFHADAGRYPASLEELVTRRYVRRIPSDPITQSASTWVTIAPGEGKQAGVFDIRSGAKGSGSNGTAYDTW